TPMRWRGPAALLLWLGATLGAAAEARADDPPPMRYVIHRRESESDVRYVYQWKVLEAALEKTRAAYGPYELALSPTLFMTEQRQAAELRRGSDKLTVMYLSTTPELERDLVPVRIPVDRGLGGYCVFLIRRENQPFFDAARSLDDLRRLKIGL